MSITATYSQHFHHQNRNIPIEEWHWGILLPRSHKAGLFSMLGQQKYANFPRFTNKYMIPMKEDSLLSTNYTMRPLFYPATGYSYMSLTSLQWELQNNLKQYACCIMRVLHTLVILLVLEKFIISYQQEHSHVKFILYILKQQKL